VIGACILPSLVIHSARYLSVVLQAFVCPDLRRFSRLHFQLAVSRAWVWDETIVVNSAQHILLAYNIMRRTSSRASCRCDLHMLFYLQQSARDLIISFVWTDAFNFSVRKKAYAVRISFLQPLHHHF